MSLIKLQLKALKYPYPFDLTKAESIRKLVIWLENLKIREYKIEDRKALSNIQSSNWDAAFEKYLQDLECPVQPSDITAALQWLVAFALNLDYEDNAEKYASGGVPSHLSAAGAAATAGCPSGTTEHLSRAGAGKGPQDENLFTDLQDPRVVAAVRQLIKTAQVSASEGNGGFASTTNNATVSIVDELLAAAQRCLCEVGPALKPGVWSAERGPRQALVGVPLGFEVEDKAVSTAASALRLLYVKDLRRLQSQIDHAIVEMQEYTANPKTDSSLGKVGR